MSPRLIQVIETIETRGKGVDGDPVRGILAYYTTDGKLLCKEPDFYLPIQDMASANKAIEYAGEIWSAAIEVLESTQSYRAVAEAKLRKVLDKRSK